jgi:hypothetical protein
MHRGPAARVGRLELSCELCNLYGWVHGRVPVSGHYCKQPAYDDRIIDLAIRKDCGCNSVLAALEVKRKSEVAAMRLLSGQNTEHRRQNRQCSVVSAHKPFSPSPHATRSKAHGPGHIILRDGESVLWLT